MSTAVQTSPFLNLPIEVVRQLLESLGVSSPHHYSDRERQRDLACIARVSKAFVEPVREVLWKYPAMRNPGRASLFEAALQSNEYLRSIPKGLKWQASNGLADSDIAYSLLRLLPQVKKVIFGSVALFPREYRTTGIFLEMIALQLTSFTFYASDFNSSIEWSLHKAKCLEDLLCGLPSLKSLSISNIDWNVELPSDIFTIAPTYSLDHLHIEDSWISTRALRWITGASENLRTFCYININNLDAATGVQDLPVVYQILERNRHSLRKLDFQTVHATAYTQIFSLKLSLSTITLGSVYWSNGHSAEAESTLITSRAHLSDLFNQIDPISLTIVSQPQTRGFLEVCGIVQVLRQGQLKALRELNIEGPFLSNELVKQAQAVCRERGIDFSTRRLFL